MWGDVMSDELVFIKQKGGVFLGVFKWFGRVKRIPLDLS